MTMNEETQQRIKSLIGEGIVIVVSILLAFAIDAMWAEHQTEQEEQSALKALKTEYTENLAQLDMVISYHLNAREAVAKLFNLSEAEIRKLSQSQISDMMLSTSNPVTFDPILGTSKSLVDSGKLGIIQDQALRSSITTFINIIVDIEEDEFFMREGALDIWRVEVTLGGPWSDPETERSAHGSVAGFDFIPKVSHDDLLRVRSDQQFKSLTHRYQINVGYYILELNRAKTTINEILARLSDY